MYKCVKNRSNIILIKPDKYKVPKKTLKKLDIKQSLCDWKQVGKPFINDLKKQLTGVRC